MIDVFESNFRVSPDQTFFTFVNSNGEKQAFSYRASRLISAALARRLSEKGIRANDTVVADLPSCPEYIFLLLAAAYGNFTVAAMKYSLSDSEKLTATFSVERDAGKQVVQIGYKKIREYIGDACDFAASKIAQNAFTKDSEIDLLEMILGGSKRERAIMGERQDIIDDTVHFAERSGHLFDKSSRALILFTRSDRLARHQIRNQSRSQSAEQGTFLKLVPLTWDNLFGSANAMNQSMEGQSHENWQERLTTIGTGSASISQPLSQKNSMKNCWQSALPITNIVCIQLLIRALIERKHLILYGSFDAEQMLTDAAEYDAKHIVVNDKMLQDLLTVEEWRRDILEESASRRSSSIRLLGYQSILISGHKLNARTVERSLDLNIRIFASFGLPETSGIIASSRIDKHFRGGMKLFPGYNVHVADADVEGFGYLAVQGPGLFAGYLNMSTPYTVDHYFMTDEVAALFEGCIYIKNRTHNMFESDGEILYPAEIADVIRHIPGVVWAYVFAVSDPKFGKCPVAIIEKSDPNLTQETILSNIRQWYQGSSVAKSIRIVEVPSGLNLPRNASGAVDMQAANEFLQSIIQIHSIDIKRKRWPFRTPLRNAYGTLTHHDTVIVEITDVFGRVGRGECVAFDGDWSKAESLSDDFEFLQDAKLLVGKTIFHPDDALNLYPQIPGADSHPMAISAVDEAIWDLYANVKNQPLWKLVNDEYSLILQKFDLKSLEDVADGGEAIRVAEIDGDDAIVNAAAVIGLGSPSVVLANAHAAVEAGYSRLKIKITPDQGFASVRSVRRAFPDLLITLDANRSFTDDDLDKLHAYDELNIGWIEEPFAIADGEDPLQKINDMQPMFATPFCVDESYSDFIEADRILDYPNIRCIALKPARFGSLRATLAFIACANAQGRCVFLADMYDSGIARKFYATLETLPGMIVPGDISSTSRYLQPDADAAPFEAVNGKVVLS